MRAWKSPPADDSFRTTLSLSDGSLMLEDQRTALGTVQPLARFGSSAFGPLRARAISADGVAGDWMPLGTLVRLPGLKDLRCPRATAKPCILTGSNLFLVDSISSTEDFANATDVPPDFTGSQIGVPHPVGGILYLKLRDDPETVQTFSLPITPMAPTMFQAATPVAPIQPMVASPAASVPPATSEPPTPSDPPSTAPPSDSTNAPASAPKPQAGAKGTTSETHNAAPPSVPHHP